jgi:metallo-beta-lactamase class B
MFAGSLLVAVLAAQPGADMAPVACESCNEWNAAQAPFRIHGNSYYVGVGGLSVVLITTSKGLILLDGGLPQSVPLIVSNLRALGRRIEDVTWIGISHAHFDHVGGVAALARLSGARVAASPAAAAALRAGALQKDDPQAGYGEAMRFPRVAKVVQIADGATIRLGDVTLTAHHTPGHTPGGTSWSWRSCEGAQGCVTIVYADSLNPISAPGFRFGADRAGLERFRRSIETVRKLPCDVLVCPHPGFAELFEKRAARDRGDGNPLIDPAACRNYAADAAAKLEKRLADER